MARVLAEYVEPTPTNVSRLLERLGADQSVIPIGFEKLSALQQIQWAYGSVEAALPGQGRAFVRSLASLVAQVTPSIALDPDVSEFLSDGSIQSFQFSQRPADAPVLATEPAVARVIAALSDVVASRGSGITAMSVMERKLGLSKEEVVEALLRFSSGKDALADALATLPEPPQKEMLAEIARDVMEKIPAARSNRVLGEAVFRWLGLSDPKYGEWSRIRDVMINKTEAGEMNAPPEQKNNAMRLVNKLRVDYAAMISSFMDGGLVPTPRDIERMHMEYAKRAPGPAALWGFAVIALKKDLDIERYVDEQAQTLRSGYLRIYEDALIEQFEKHIGHAATVETRLAARDNVAKEHGNDLDWRQEARESLPKPYHGYVEYVRLTGFGGVEEAGQYFDSLPVLRAIDKYCPVPVK